MNYFINNKKRYYIYINIIETHSYSFPIILYNYFKNKKYQLYLWKCVYKIIWYMFPN